ncbi:hypothetical protein E2C01_016951 [Portunus trituberculatus]|uniref:Uncharacterized protein n=1 Tax=Portunus trituberculatus TaxID=210409 RepID=A0A5B7DRL3_PORTR|nr:hypothetical protein [Portunus trituberculatus]
MLSLTEPQFAHGTPAPACLVSLTMQLKGALPLEPVTAHVTLLGVFVWVLLVVVAGQGRRAGKSDVTLGAVGPLLAQSAAPPARHAASFTHRPNKDGPRLLLPQLVVRHQFVTVLAFCRHLPGAARLVRLSAVLAAKVNPTEVTLEGAEEVKHDVTLQLLSKVEAVVTQPAGVRQRVRSLFFLGLPFLRGGWGSERGVSASPRSFSSCEYCLRHWLMCSATCSCSWDSLSNTTLQNLHENEVVLTWGREEQRRRCRVRAPTLPSSAPHSVHWYPQRCARRPRVEENVRLHELQVREGRLKASWPGVRKCFKRGVACSTWEMSPSSCTPRCVASSLPWGNIAVVQVHTPFLATRYIRGNNYHDSNTPVNLRAERYRDLAAPSHT